MPRSPGKSLWIGSLLALAALVVYLGCNQGSTAPGESHASSARTEVVQPLQFDHKVHIEAEDMDCLDCHKFAAKSPNATLPLLKDCKDCHSEAQGKHPDEPKVREYLEANKEIPWERVNRMPGHVYFSHRAHVGFAEMKCWDCHTDFRQATKPLVKSDVEHLTMAKCMECHKQKNADNQCSACHK
jgi:menaquinone reductase, multiheme cytochrome c subunit